MELPKPTVKGPVSWMDQRKIDGESPREILNSISGDFGFTTNETPYILIRFDKLKQLGYAQGRSPLELILTAAYLYLRWEGSGRQPCSATRFVKVCKAKGYFIPRPALFRLSRLFLEANLFPDRPLLPQKLLEKKWPALKSKYGLSDEMKAMAIQLILLPNFAQGKSPEAVVAATLYAAFLGCGSVGRGVTQRVLSDELGTTDVTLRNVKQALDDIVNGKEDASDGMASHQELHISEDQPCRESRD